MLYQLDVLYENMTPVDVENMLPVASVTSSKDKSGRLPSRTTMSLHKMFQEFTFLWTFMSH